jgi:hypothetical protein
VGHSDGYSLGLAAAIAKALLLIAAGGWLAGRKIAALHRCAAVKMQIACPKALGHFCIETNFFLGGVS